MKTSFGTRAFTGLDVSRGAHLIEDSSLVRSTNGWTDEEGVLRVAKGQERLYTGYGDISCFASGRQQGSDTLVWMDGNDVYANGGKVGEIPAGDDMYARDFDDKFYFMGSTEEQNYIYDGDVVRQHGCWQLDEYSTVTSVTDADTTTIVGITEATQAVFTMTAGHGIVAGMPFYVSGCTGMTAFNGRIVTALSVLANDVTVDEDSSDYGAYTASTGTATEESCGITGTYKYYFVPTVKFADDSVIFGKPRGVTFGSWTTYLTAEDTWDAEAITLTPADKVIVQARFNPDFDCSGTVGVDYTPGIRLYRTKSNGADYYLENEWYIGDSDLPLIGSNYNTNASYSAIAYRSAVHDIDLGAVYLPGATDHEVPPPASLMDLVGQRLFMNDINNPQRLYFSGLDGVDYVPTLNYLLVPDVITGIGSVGSICVVFSADRMWRVSMLGGIPDMDEIETPVGTDYGRVMATMDMGLLFLRKDGLWSTSGSTPPIKVSRKAFPLINEPTTITAHGDIVYVGDSNTGYVMIRRDGGLHWHEHRVQHTLADATNGRFYAAGASTVYALFEGDDMAADVQTKDFTNYSEMQVTRAVIDYAGDDVPAVWINGNRQSDYDGHPDEGSARQGDRRLLRFSIPRLINHVVNIRVTMSGNGALYGAWLEAE